MPPNSKKSCSLPLKVTRKMFKCLLDKFDPTGKVNQINVRKCHRVEVNGIVCWKEVQREGREGMRWGKRK